MQQDGYSLAVDHVLHLRQVSTLDLSAALSCGLAMASGHLRRMEQEGIVGPAKADGTRAVLRGPRSTDEQPRRPDAGTRERASTNPAQRDDVAALRLEIVALKEEGTRLRDKGRQALRERDEWRSRALDAEQRLQNTPGASGGRDDRFSRLKRMLAQNLHPDMTSASGLEKILREEMFKQLWPLVEAIERNE